MTKEFFTQLQQMIAAHWPGTAAMEVRIKLTTGQKVTLPVPSVVPAAVVPPTPPKQEKFVPSVLQKAILKALEGGAMRTADFERIKGLGNNIFKKNGGISELQSMGLVGHHKRLGFYLVESPPPELRDDTDDDDDDDLE